MSVSPTKSTTQRGETFLNPNFGKNSAADSIFGTDFNLQQYSLYGSYNFANNLRVLARVGANVRDFNAKYFYTASTFDESREIVNTLWSQVSIIKSKTSQGEHDALRLAPLQPNWEVNLGMRRTQDEFDFNPLIPANRHTMTKMALNANKRFQIKKKAWFSAGLQLENRQIVSTDRGDHQNLDGGLYLIMNTAIRKKNQYYVWKPLGIQHEFQFCLFTSISHLACLSQKPLAARFNRQIHSLCRLHGKVHQFQYRVDSSKSKCRESGLVE